MEKPKLPEPSEGDAKAFQELYLRRFNLELSDEEAYRVASQVIGIVYVQTYFRVEPETEQINAVDKPEQLTLF